MEVIILHKVEAVARLGAKHLCDVVRDKPNAVLGLATGATPIIMYKNLISAFKAQQVSFKSVKTFNLDEYLGIDSENVQSYRYFMNRELFNYIDIDIVNTYLPKCDKDQDPNNVGPRYEEKIELAGGIDLQILGIGSNGHIGFNEPGSSLTSRTRVKTLTEKTIKDNSSLFSPDEFQPRLAITMGIGTIMDAEQILLLATGGKKASAVKNMIEGPVSSRCPASILQMHQKATVLLDEAAASRLESQEYYRWVYNEKEMLRYKK